MCDIKNYNKLTLNYLYEKLVIMIINLFKIKINSVKVFQVK